MPAPVTPKPVPDALICEIRTLELPLLVITTPWEEAPPVATFPKFRLVALKARLCVAAMPVPLNGKVAGEFGALLMIDTLPETAPAEAGRYCTLNIVDVLGFRDNGRVSPLVLNPLPAALTWLIVKTAVPEFPS